MSTKKIITLDILMFFSLYIIMPSYFAFEISSSFPLLTFSRLLLLLIIVLHIVRRHGKIRLKVFENRLIGRSTIIYYILILLTNLIFITQTSESLKAIFTVIFEELCLVWIISQIINTREKLIKCLKIMVYTSGVVAVLACFESFFNINIFYFFNTVQREMLMSSFTRLGLLRAEAGFGHAVYYGTYCAMMIPVCMYFIENFKKGRKLYAGCLLLNLVGLFLANSRGSIIALVMLMLFMLVNKKLYELFKYIKLFIVAIMMLLIIVFISPNVLSYIVTVLQSIIDVFSSNSTVIEGYGTNLNALASRTTQFSGILWTLQRSPIWGFGANAHTRGLISYQSATGQWLVTNTFDMGYVSIFCQYGIVGSIAYLTLFISLLIGSFTKKNDDGSGLIRMFRYSFIVYFLCLFSISQIQKLLWILIALFVSYLNIIQKENSGEQL